MPPEEGAAPCGAVNERRILLLHQSIYTSSFGVKAQHAMCRKTKRMSGLEVKRKASR